MKVILCFLCSVVSLQIIAQQLPLDSINFQDTLQFKQTIHYNSRHQVERIQYDAHKGGFNYK